MAKIKNLSFAQVDDQDVVTNVIVVTPGDQDPLDFITNTLKLQGTWLETNGEGLRKNLAGVGFTYSQELDAFIPPKPYNSWLLDEQTCTWVAPVSKPDDGEIYEWNESVIDWQNAN